MASQNGEFLSVAYFAYGRLSPRISADILTLLLKIVNMRFYLKIA